MPCILFCDDGGKKTLTYIISKTDHLEKIWWGGTLILLHPRTSHKFWRLDRSVQVELQQRHLSGNLNRMKLKQTNKMQQFTLNFFSQEFHMKLYYNYAFLWYNLSESYMRHNGDRTAVLSYIDTNKVSIIIPSWDQTDPCP